MTDQAFRGNTSEKIHMLTLAKRHHLLITERLAEYFSCYAFMVSPFCLILLFWFCIRDEHSGIQEVTAP